jgi:HEAT repeat protein
MSELPWGRRIALPAALATAVVIAAWPDALVAAWEQLVGLIAVEGDPIPASPAVMSEHEIQELDALEPQAQAERLLERAINHYRGAAALITKHVDRWRGEIALDGPLEGLYMTALNANDLRVRAAALEVYLAANDVGKTPEELQQIMDRCDAQSEGRPYFLWIVGIMGNRGADPQRALDYLLRFVNDEDLETRHWAVDGLAILGTDEAIAPLLRVFHDEPSPFVRERAACGLAQSGMFTARQRWTAIPELLRFADDPALDEKTRGWVFQALSDISGLGLGHDAAEWRAWWAKGPQPATSVAQ